MLILGVRILKFTMGTNEVSFSLDAKAEKTTTRGGNPANFISVFQALIDDLSLLFAPQLNQILESLMVVKGELSKCQQELSITQQNEQLLLEKITVPVKMCIWQALRYFGK